MEEAKVLRRLRRGDQSALMEIIDTYTPYVGTIVYHIIGTRMDAADVEEVTADVFFALWNQADRVRPGHLKGYLSRIARNRAVNKLRELRVDLSLEENELGEPAGNGTPETEVIGREERKAVRRALDSMREPEREIFLRHYYYCQTVCTISVEMGLNPSTVKSKLVRGRKKLKQSLMEGGLSFENN